MRQTSTKLLILAPKFNVHLSLYVSYSALLSKFVAVMASVKMESLTSDPPQCAHPSIVCAYSSLYNEVVKSTLKRLAYLAVR